MLRLLFGLGKLIEQNYLQIFIIKYLCYLNLKKYFAKHKLKTIVVGHQAFYKRQPIPRKKK